MKGAAIRRTGRGRTTRSLWTASDRAIGQGLRRHRRLVAFCGTEDARSWARRPERRNEMAKLASNRLSQWSALALCRLLNDLSKLSSTPANSNRTLISRRNAWPYKTVARTFGQSCRSEERRVGKECR